jgi:hypothetical protein
MLPFYRRVVFIPACVSSLRVTGVTKEDTKQTDGNEKIKDITTAGMNVFRLASKVQPEAH